MLKYVKWINGIFICKECGSGYLREIDAIKCGFKEMETPIITVGTVLIDNSYDMGTEIRCYSFNIKGHDIVYNFEWEREEGEWEHAYSVKGTERMGMFLNETS